MADPRNELADIIAPAAPDMAPVGTGLPLWVPILALAAGTCILLAAWVWRRRRPLRVLQRITTDVARRQGTLPELSAHLDAWARVRFGLAWVDAALCPPGVDSVVWADWATVLTQLRFALPPPDGYAHLAVLCEQACLWERHV